MTFWVGVDTIRKIEIRISTDSIQQKRDKWNFVFIGQRWKNILKLSGVFEAIIWWIFMPASMVGIFSR